ncbi:MAG: hypothetical protein IPK72_02045 [Candidatus Eisenbacteria bacterium]|nr:hypothetical protein [Candidatus Eisenbacteria bacterium]
MQSDLDEAVRKYLAWDSIVRDRETLNLTSQQAKQAETQRASADGTVTSRIPEAYQWLLVPGQKQPGGSIEWEAIRVAGADVLAIRASKRLRNDEALILSYAPTVLRLKMDEIPLWRGDHVTVNQLAEDFARYLYLPRLQKPAVLVDACRRGCDLLTWDRDTFAFADGHDEVAGRYRGLRCGELVTIVDEGSTALLVRAEVARRQQAAETPGSSVPTDGGTVLDPRGSTTPGSSAGSGGGVPPKSEARRPARFHGNAELDPNRVGRDASKIAEEIISHLTGLMGARVRVTLEIEAEVLDGVPENIVRTVTENSRTLKLTSHGFETE